MHNDCIGRRFIQKKGEGKKTKKGEKELRTSWAVEFQRKGEITTEWETNHILCNGEYNSISWWLKHRERTNDLVPFHRRDARQMQRVRPGNETSKQCNVKTRKTNLKRKQSMHIIFEAFFLFSKKSFSAGRRYSHSTVLIHPLISGA